MGPVALGPKIGWHQCPIPLRRKKGARAGRTSFLGYSRLGHTAGEDIHPTDEDLPVGTPDLAREVPKACPVCNRRSDWLHRMWWLGGGLTADDDGRAQLLTEIPR